MNSNIKVVYADLPTTIGGFVKETDGYYTIVLNSRMTFERNRKSYIHELSHIDNMDLDRNCNADQIELEANRRKGL